MGKLFPASPPYNELSIYIFTILLSCRIGRHPERWDNCIFALPCSVAHHWCHSTVVSSGMYTDSIIVYIILLTAGQILAINTGHSDFTSAFRKCQKVALCVGVMDVYHAPMP